MNVWTKDLVFYYYTNNSLSKGIITIFITDDDADDREFLTEALSDKGFEGILKLFANGQHLMDHLERHTLSIIDLIVLDLNMPVKDGYITLTELKHNEKYKHIPVMILTSSSREDDEQFCYNLGCNHFMRKPLSLTGYRKLAEDIITYAEKVHITEDL